MGGPNAEDTKGMGKGLRGGSHQVALLTAVLARQAAAAVGVGTCWPWGNCCYVAVCSAARGASVPTGEGEGRGHIVAAARLQLVRYFRNTRPTRNAWLSIAEGRHFRFTSATSYAGGRYNIPVCLSRTSGLTRVHRGLGRLKLAQR